jgi:ribose-phosphate pyrophosphokinase
LKIVACGNTKQFIDSLTTINQADVCWTEVSRFEDNEMLVKIEDQKLLQNDVVLVVQSISGNVNDALIELLFTLDVVHSITTKDIYLLVTYLGYSRQDRIETLTQSFSAKVIGNLLSVKYIKKMFVIDLHAPQTLGFFNVPSINLDPDFFIVDKIRKEYSLQDIVLVSPDVGNAKSIIKISNELNVGYAVAIKYRPEANQNKILSVIGHDVKEKTCIIIDDIIDSAGTLCNVAERLTQQGATKIIAYITHPVLSSKSIDRINKSFITKLYVSDTINTTSKIEEIRNIEIFSLGDWCLTEIKKYLTND